MTNNNQNELSKELLPFIIQKWHSPLALLLLVVVELLFLLRYCWQNFGEGISVYELVVIVACIVGSALTWVLTRKYPKNARNKVGIIVAVTTESKKEYLRLKSDLILRLKEVIATKFKENIFNIIEMPEYYASKIEDHPSSRKALKKAHAHFIIYGSCKQRFEKGIKNYFMALEATVVHKPIPKMISDELAREFAELFPRKLIFSIEDEISGFEITNEWIGLSARYIIGIAAFLSGDFDLSYELDRELHGELKSIHTKIKQIKKIKTRIPHRIVESALALADRNFFIYRRTKNKESLHKLKPLLDTLRRLDPNNYKGHLLRGIYFFLAHRDIKRAKNEIKQCKNIVDVAWRFSDAFLCAYEGDLDKAEKSYKKVFKFDIKPHVLFQVEEFIYDVLEDEPNNCHLWYCVGMINMFVKEDKILAKQTFEKFLKCGSDSDYKSQKEKVKIYLNQIRNHKNKLE